MKQHKLYTHPLKCGTLVAYVTACGLPAHGTYKGPEWNSVTCKNCLNTKGSKKSRYLAEAPVNLARIPLLTRRRRYKHI